VVLIGLLYMLRGHGKTTSLLVGVLTLIITVTTYVFALPMGLAILSIAVATTLGKDNTYGALAGRTPAGPVSFARISTDDVNGRIRTYVADVMMTNDPLATFGSRAVGEVAGLQALLRHVCKNGFEHHVAINASLGGRPTSAALACLAATANHPISAS
jgi:L-fucose isomerase-like protein